MKVSIYNFYSKADLIKKRDKKRERLAKANDQVKALTWEINKMSEVLESKYGHE